MPFGCRALLRSSSGAVQNRSTARLKEMESKQGRRGEGRPQAAVASVCLQMTEKRLPLNLHKHYATTLSGCILCHPLPSPAQPVVLPTPPQTPTSPTFPTGFHEAVLVALEKRKSHPRHMDHPVAVNIALSGSQVAMGAKETRMNGL